MVKNLNSKEFQESLQNDDNAVIIDVRTKGEYFEGYIPGAINVDIYSPDFADKMIQMDKSKNYYVYCRSGGRSMAACQWMVANGFQNVANLNGGIMAWNGEIKMD
ncbi:MAG: rhodanese [Vicingaceae bacterium]|jgi:rhodanese-related sulfurtransferase|nr:MAG: rhodanese [Vicingaceae bacterium]